MHTKPPLELLSLLAAENIQHDGTWSGIIQATQHRWVHYIRPNNLPQQNISSQIVQEFEGKREKLMPFFEKLGLIEKIMPDDQYYDYIFILGSCGPEIKSRILFLNELLQNGLRTQQIVLLCGERETDEQFDDLATTRSLVSESISLKSETEILCALYFFYGPPSYPTQLIISQQRHGHLPNTEDHAIDWLKTRPTSGSVLALSNQPYCARQRAALRKHLPRAFTIDIAGPAINHEDIPVAILLDTLGRTLYIENQNRLS